MKRVASQLPTIVALMLSPLAVGGGDAFAAPAKKVLVLGVDGLDPVMLQAYVNAGLMPNFKRLMDEGDFKPLGTSMPPQSPVAWSNFITGMDPGGHGIFDFVHRDPKTDSPSPYLSIAKTHSAERTLKFGKWVVPIGSGKVELQRKGKAFWQLLDEAGIPTTIFRMPANFPPVGFKGKSLSGMGTPDLLGTPGSFSYYTQNPEEVEEDVGGGEVYKVSVRNNRVKAKLVGPKNSFKQSPKKKSRKSRKGKPTEYENPETKIAFDVYLDPEEAAAKFEVQDHEFILKEGEWSNWVRIDFEAVPWLVSFSGTVKFYLQQVRPSFKLYVTPIQINPEEPVMPISTPADWCACLCEKLGYFYTQEMPEDTKALTHGIFSGREFHRQASMVFEERRRAFEYLMDEFEEGLLFIYFSSVDQQSHMLWRYSDENHPGYDPTEGLAGGIASIYQEMDAVLGRTLEAIDDGTTLIVMSDHGFAPFYWGVNLNTWLLENGYIKLKKPAQQGQHKFYGNVDWRKSRAYALGLNGLYINLKGREKAGIVRPGQEYEDLVSEIEDGLRSMRDTRNTRNGQEVISLVTRPSRDFHGPLKDSGPDLLIGYARGYRSSWESPLGEFPKQILVDNDRAWSADHCIDYRLVPGVLLTNQEITDVSPSLIDLTVAILDEYGIKPLPEMIGKDCLHSPAKRQVSAGRKR